MKFLSIALLGIIMTSTAQAQEISVLISGFDPFGGSSQNNAQIVAKKIVNELQKSHPQYIFKFCQLRTVYDKAEQELLDCYHSMDVKPKFIISIGEGNNQKQIVLETRGHNLDDSSLADNDGILRQNYTISNEHPLEVGSTLDWSRAYCKLSPIDKTKISLSNDPGNFVCNNTIFRMSAFNNDVSFGFIHVPSFKRRFMNTSKVKLSSNLIKMLVLNLIKDKDQLINSYPTRRSEIEELLADSDDHCDKEFYQKLLLKY